MAEENVLVQTEKKSKTMLIVIIVVVVNLVIGGVVIAMMMGGGADDGHQKKPSGAVTRPKGNVPGPIVQLENFVVNIQSEETSKYLKAGLAVELASERDQELFNNWSKLVRNEVLIYLSSLEVAETLTAKQKRLIEGKLKDLINQRIGADIVTGTYFTEFVTQ